MKKKSQMPINSTIGIIILLITLIVIIFFLFNTNTKLEDKAESMKCKAAIEQNHLRRKTMMIKDVKESDYSITSNCPTKYVTLHKENYESEFEDDPLDKETKPKEYSYECKKEPDSEKCFFNKINNVIANQAAECWDMFGQGRLSVFTRYIQETQCLVCAVIYFDAELQDQYGGEYIGLRYKNNQEYILDTFMRNHNVPYIYSPDSISYYEYSLDFIDKFITNPYYDYDMDKEYAIVFIALNEDKTKLLTGALYEKFTKDDEDPDGNYMNRLEFIPNDQITEYCRVIK